MTIRMSDLLVEMTSKKLDVLLEARYKKALKKEEHTPEHDSDEEEQEVLHRDPETGQLGKKKIKVARKKSMHSTSKQAQAAASAGGKGTPSTKSSKKEKPVAAGSKEHAKKMASAKAEFDAWDAKRKLKGTDAAAPSKSAEDEGHRRALAAAKRKAAKKAAKSQVSEETDAEHAKKLGRDIDRYTKGGNAAHKAALAAAKKLEARKKGAK